MLQRIRRFIAGATAAALASAALVCTPPDITVRAMKTGTLSASDETAVPGGTADVSVFIEENPGITALSFNISYDDTALTLLGAEDTGLLGTATPTFGNDLTRNPYTLCWDDLVTEDHTENGRLAVLHFQVAEDAPLGSPTIFLTVNTTSTFNVALENVPFFTINGHVSIEAPAETTAPAETSMPAETTAETAASTEQAPVQTSVATEQTTVSTAQATASTEQTASSTIQTAATTMQTAVSTIQTAATTVQTAASTVQTAATTMQTTVSTVQTAATTAQTAASTVHTTTQAVTTTVSNTTAVQTTAAPVTTSTAQTTAASTTAAATTAPAVSTAATAATTASTAATHPAATTHATNPATVPTAPVTTRATAASTVTTTTAVTPASEGLLAVDSVQATPGSTISVPVLLQSNPGIAALSFDVSYDATQLRLIDVQDGNLLPGAAVTFGGDMTAVPYRLCWDSLATSNYTQTGTLATLVFRVINTAEPGNCRITLSLNKTSTFDVALRSVPFAVSSGTVEILPYTETQATTATDPTETTATETTAAGTTETTPAETTAETVPTEPVSSGSISADSCVADAGQEVEVLLHIADTPALNQLLLRIGYDTELLTLLSAENGGILPDDSLKVMEQQGQLLLWWDNSNAPDDAITDGVLVRLRFRTSAQAEDLTEALLTVTAESAYHGAKEKLTLLTENGSILIHVPEAPSFRLGDVNNDGFVNATDAAQILIAAARIGAGDTSGLTETQQLAANVNGDAAINASDAAVVLIYAAAVGAGSYTGSLEDYLKARVAPSAQANAPALKRRYRSGLTRDWSEIL